jgi:hypothetical protein
MPPSARENTAGINLCYEDHGSGSPVVLLSGSDHDQPGH